MTCLKNHCKQSDIFRRSQKHGRATLDNCLYFKRKVAFHFAAARMRPVSKKRSASGRGAKY
ncbi:NAD/NADP transhydrogenase beta subunit [Neisseria bacilliformis ATCC BAA-1200]|uniref:NAD/NADP transhydrogenase beta subunit n=1 Tax=Neisseria bacilliformis ATCC BAA-1200 TaxID=888742 RepID=F2BC64_9NEIS|nr:NAD/NADP transhydrogenase beta subunit [Neisseria bacilliformis ATCC BAA-1200]